MEKVSQLINLFEASSLTELSYQGNEFTLSLKRGSVSSEINFPVTKDLTTPQKNSLPKQKRYICSEGIGTFYTSPSPTEPPFVSVGDVVKIGQVVGILEAMKVMTEIKATCEGKVEKILISNGEMVEFGTNLIEVSDV